MMVSNNRIPLSRRLGSSWKGSKYVHGPRRVDPRRCKEIRLGQPTKKGKRLVWCQKANGQWVIQSLLTPKTTKSQKKPSKVTRGKPSGTTRRKSPKTRGNKK